MKKILGNLIVAFVEKGPMGFGFIFRGVLLQQL